MMIKRMCVLLAILVTSPWTIQAQQGSDDPGKSVLEKLKKERTTEFEKLQEAKVLVVTDKHRDIFDHVEKVLDGLKIQNDQIRIAELPNKDLSPYPAVFINCYGIRIRVAGGSGAGPPTEIPDEIRTKLRAYVEKGGFLFTSDWALTVTALTFPEFLTKPLKSSGDKNETISVRPQDADHPFLRDVFGSGKNTAMAGRKAKWMIEAQSRTFDIVPSAKGKVKVLLVSDDLKNKYGSNLVGVTFTVGEGGISTGKYEGTAEGAVLHVIGHFYQQELGNKDNTEVAKMYQMIANFVIEARKNEKKK